MRHLLIFGLLSALTLTQCTVNKLIVKAENGKFKIKENMSIAVTKNGENYAFDESCKSICKGCDTKFDEARWEIDSLQNDGIVFRENLEFVYDTITQQEYKTLSGREKKKDLEVVISINRRPHYVYKIPTEVERTAVAFKDMNRITYTYKPKCYKGLFEKIFANPNKIRRIDMEGARTKVIYR